MNMLFSALFALCGIVFAGTIWFLICNQRTFKDRLALIASIRTDDVDWSLKYDLYDAVTYDQHLWSYFWFRRPQDLYDRRLLPR